MIATAEIDKSGRLVVPKRLRDALRLTAGTRLTVRQQGGSLVLEPEQKPARFSMKNGLPLVQLGYELPPDHVNWLQQNREDPHYDDD